jgi:SAM-dependent methyltransferase
MSRDPTRSRPGYEDGAAGRLVAPAASRNAGPIAEALRELLAGGGGGVVLEIGAGTGQHAVACAEALPHLTWAPSDPDPAHVASIAAWAREARASGVENIAEPVRLDATDDWAAAVALTHGPLRAAFCANVIHISPWAVAEGLAAGAGRAVGPGGRLILYGPFYEDGETAPTNRDFDRSLRAQDPDWGVRDVRDVSALAARHGFGAPERVEMPANNLILAFPR